MPGKPPYFPYYPKDIDGDPIVRMMSLEQFGAYQRLLNAAWQQDQCGTLPDDDDALAKVIGIPLRKWKAMRGPVLQAFTKGDDGRWHQKRMKHEFDKLQKRSKAGSKPKQKAIKTEAKGDHRYGYGYGDGSGSASGGGAGGGTDPPSDAAGRRETPPPMPNQPPESRLAQIWLFFLKGPRNKATEINSVAEVMAELLRKGTTFEQIEARISDKSRDWSEPIWEFAKHWKLPAKRKQQTTAEAVDELQKFVQGAI